MVVAQVIKQLRYDLFGTEIDPKGRGHGTLYVAKKKKKTVKV